MTFLWKKLNKSWLKTHGSFGKKGIDKITGSFQLEQAITKQNFTIECEKISLEYFHFLKYFKYFLIWKIM